MTDHVIYSHPIGLERIAIEGQTIDSFSSCLVLTDITWYDVMKSALRRKKQTRVSPVDPEFGRERTGDITSYYNYQTCDHDILENSIF